MTTILILGQEILAIGVTEYPSMVVAADGTVFHKLSIPGYQVVDAEVPAGYAPGKFIFEGGLVVAKPDSAEEVAALGLSLLTQINALCDEKMGVIKAGYPESEVSTWDQQVREALGYQADPLMDVPLIGNLATARGLTKAELVSRILTKATAFSALAGQIIGRRQALEDAINAAATLDALGVVAAQISEGWPV